MGDGGGGSSRESSITVMRRGSSNRHPIFLPDILPSRFGIVFVHTTAHRPSCIIVDDAPSRHTIPKIQCGPYTMKQQYKDV